MSKERVQKLMGMKESDLLKERQALRGQILALRTDVANHKTTGIHKFKVMRRDIARIETILAGKENNDR